MEYRPQKEHCNRDNKDTVHLEFRVALFADKRICKAIFREHIAICSKYLGKANKTLTYTVYIYISICTYMTKPNEKSRTT